MIPRDFHFGSFENVWYLLGLIFLTLVFFFSLLKKKKQKQELVEKNLQSQMIIPEDPILVGIKFVCFLLGWGFATFALMNPIGNEYYKEKSKYAIKSSLPLDLIILMDVSQSMAVADVRNKMTRLQAAEEIIDYLVAKLKIDPVELLAFTNELVPIVPMTYDRIFFRLMLREIQLNEDNHFGTNFKRIFNQLKAQISDNYSNGKKVILLFSDGGDTASESLSGNNRIEALNGIITEAAALNVPIFTIGMGSKNGGIVPEVQKDGKQVVSQLNEELLKLISEKTGGKYFQGGEESASSLAAQINQSIERSRLSLESFSSDVTGSFHYYFQVPLSLAIFFFFLHYFIPSSKKFLFLISLLVSFYSYAQDAGKIYFESGQYEESANWYASELKHIQEEWLRNKLLYNLGTSLLANKKWDEASHAFFAISKEAYKYPIFRLRLLYNQVLILWKQSELGNSSADNLQETLLILELAEIENPLKDQIKIRLSKEKPSSLDKSIDRMIRVLRIASLLPHLPSRYLNLIEVYYNQFLTNASPTEKMKEAKHFIELTEKADTLEEVQELLTKAALSLEQDKQLEAKTPVVFIQSLLDELVLASTLKNVESTVFKDGSQFFPFLIKWQKMEFEKRKCQCRPWNEALPVFTDGLRALQEPPFPGQVFYVYEKWQDVLKLLKDQSSLHNQLENNENKELRELQEMQTLDKEKPQVKMKPIGEGMPW